MKLQYPRVVPSPIWVCRVPSTSSLLGCPPLQCFPLSFTPELASTALCPHWSSGGVPGLPLWWHHALHWSQSFHLLRVVPHPWGIHACFSCATGVTLFCCHMVLIYSKLHRSGIINETCFKKWIHKLLVSLFNLLSKASSCKFAYSISLLLYVSKILLQFS